jgi:large subunit ribosomal protein L4
VFGPKPRDYSKKTSKTLRRLAFRKALSERISAGDVLTIDKFVVPEIKTKSFMSILQKATDARKVLVIADSFDENTFKSARNVKTARLATAADVNTEQLLGCEKILVTQKALDKLAERTNPPSPKATAR